MRAGAFCLIGSWVGSWALGFLPIWGQMGSLVPAPVERETHIAVQVRDALGEPVRRLEARNFQVKLVGGKVSTPAQVNVAGVRDRRSHGIGVPTKLLVVLLTSDAGVVRQLPDRMDALWKANWKVSVLDAQGFQTPYVSSPVELKRELAHAGQTHRSINLATARLTRFEGRRVVFLVTQPGVSLDDVTLAEALLPGISVYHVGGDPWKQEVAAGYGAAGSNSLSSTSSDDAVSMVDGDSDAPLFVRVRYRETEERTFGGAVREALRDGHGYYDLTVNVPADVTRLVMGVNISDSAGGTYSIYAQPYIREGRPPELSVVGAMR